MRTDHLSKEQRSRCMSRIRSKWTAPERKIHNMLKGRRIRHMMHPKIEGSPDIVFPGRKISVFIDGCFWHGCPKCYRKPKNNSRFWKDKVERNMRRDRSDRAKMRREGWRVVSLWEHQIDRDIDACVGRIQKLLTAA